MTDVRIERIRHNAKWLLDATPRARHADLPQEHHAARYIELKADLDSLEAELEALRSAVKDFWVYIDGSPILDARAALTTYREEQG